MKYPYIGEAVTGNIYLMTSSNDGVRVTNGSIHSKLNGRTLTNITREYLEGKCVKIESPEHEVFLNSFDIETRKVIVDGVEYINFGGVMHSAEPITIPLPPKSDGWPKVGDTVTWGNRVISGEVKAVDGDVAWIVNNYGNYVTEYLRDLAKPKTEAEMLRDDLILCIQDSNQTWRDKIYQDKGVKIENSVYEFVADKLLSKYNITKGE